jgi:hypothetical protein
MKTEIVLRITLTPEYVLENFGVEIPLEDWDLFCKEFERWYTLEYNGTIEWMLEEWENIKDGNFG